MTISYAVTLLQFTFNASVRLQVILQQHWITDHEPQNDQTFVLGLRTHVKNYVNKSPVHSSPTVMQ